ncbi:hypothetical protein ACU686_12165 [Yinghuangia aomiensis]
MMFLATSCASGDEPDAPPAPSAPPAAASGGVGAASSGGSDAGKPDTGKPASGLPRAGSFEEVAALLKPALGACERMDTTGPETKLDRADQVRGGKQKALCWYGGQQFSVSILLVDADNSTLEAFHKENDTYSSERIGMGFTVRLVGTASAQVKTTAEQRLTSTGLPFLNCEQDFAPHDGVELIEAKTAGCRYTPTPRI